MRKIRLDKNTEITTEVVKYVLDQHTKEKSRIGKLKKYYDNKNDILDRVYTDQKKPQNKLSNPYASYITNSAVGYFLGKPISYKSENKEFLKELTNIFNYNDEVDHNTTLAKNSSIGGYSYELLYADEKANPRFKAQAGNEIIVVFDNTVEENYLFAIRSYNEKAIGEDKEIIKIEVYTDAIRNDKFEIIEQGRIIYFILDNNEVIEDTTRNENPEEDHYHYFGDVPVVEYPNPDYFGDFEKVMTLIDAYDKTQSDSANDFELFTHAMLVISGYVVEKEDSDEINEKYMINFQDADGKAEYLIKNIQDTALENYKNRLNDDIHKFSNIPNMSDENFASNASGIAMKFKLMGLENITGIKEAKFRKGIMRRIELICNYLKVKLNKDYDYTEIEPVFTRNRPINEVEVAQMMMNLKGILSDDTLLAMHPAVTDVELEKEKIKEQQESMYTDYSNLDIDEENEEDNKTEDE